MKKYGFYCWMYGRDCFIETKQTRRTDNLAEDFIISVQFKLGWNRLVADDLSIEHVKNTMRPATFEIKTIENGDFAGLKYYEINGESFGYGCDACENPMEHCIAIFKEA